MTTWLHAVLDLPADDGGATAFWAEALGWPLGEPWPGHPELRSFTPPAGDAYLHRQTVAGPAAVHLDLEVADVDAETRRLVALGAAPVRRTDGRQTLRSPGGLPLCLVAGRTHASRPAPLTTGGGHRRRLVQVCVDIPPQHLAVEAAFWRAALGWREVAIDDPEFLGRLVPPAGSALQVLLQRLGADDGATATRAHLDLGAGGAVAADAALLQDLGATHLHDGSGFVALRDPAGLAFCTTGNDPDAP